MDLEFKKIEFHKKYHVKLDNVELESIAMCYSTLVHSSMVVKIAIWIVGSHDFTIPPHQND